MIRLNNTNNHKTVSSPHLIYKDIFRRRCLDLIGQGYKHLDCKSLHDKEEPDVTGCLVKAIQKIMDDPIGADWMDYYFLKDNPPLNVPGKLGKSRPLADIEFELANNRPRIHFRIEAKWIGKNKSSIGSRNGYLGEEGIFRFLNGYYPTDIGYAGMLAYVFSDNEIIWSQKIKKQMSLKKKSLYLKMLNDRVWERDKEQNEFQIYFSQHDCPKPVGYLNISHMFIQFC